MRYTLLLLLLLAAPFAQAQDLDAFDRFQFNPDLAYAADVPSPEAFLGYEIGREYTPHALVMAYLRAVAAASPRVEMHEYARTYEARALYYLVITSPANHGNLEAIRQANLALAASPNGPSAQATIANNPAISWLSYNVHGNEASSSEAAMQVVYRLAAAQDAETQAILQNSVVIIDPMINPDGRDRYVHWYNAMKSHRLNDDANDLEHDEPWPGGRTNHYWFDLNRDWVWLVHPESRGRIAAYQQWLPQIHVDYHEQGFNNNYFTMPGQSPRNLLLPDAYDDWAERFGQANAEAFDAARVNYFTREAFDFFYPGYGSSYPSTMGAIGMLTEQGGHSRGGRAVVTDDGYVLTLRQRAFDHYTTSIASLNLVADNRAELLRYFADFYDPGSSESDVATYLIPDDQGRGYASDVVSILLQHGVEVQRATEAFTTSARDFITDAPARQTFAAGTFIVSTDQPRHMFVNTIMQRNLAIEDSVMYDMATWSAPLAYNLGASYTTAPVSVSARAVTSAPTVPQGIKRPNAQYAYVIDWAQRNAPAALAALWREGYRVRSAQRAFGDGTDSFSRGSLIVLLGRNMEKLGAASADMQRIATETGVEIVGMNSGRMAEGIDLASGRSEPLSPPNVALLAGEGTNSYTAGQIWFVFDRFTDFGITRLRPSALGNLADYDVLILPGLWGNTLDEGDRERIKAWVQAGGTLVATEGSAEVLTKERTGFTNLELVKLPTAKKPEAEAPGPDENAYTRYEAREDTFGLQRIPGSAFLGRLDTSHPLAFGMPETLPSLRFSTNALRADAGYEVVGYYDRDPANVLLAGYASQENQRKLSGGVFAGVERMGRGKVVFLADNTQYRMFWIGPVRLLQNAVMLMPSM